MWVAIDFIEPKVLAYGWRPETVCAAIAEYDGFVDLFRLPFTEVAAYRATGECMRELLAQLGDPTAVTGRADLIIRLDAALVALFNSRAPEKDVQNQQNTEDLPDWLKNWHKRLAA